jgi:hypothetical protein
MMMYTTTLLFLKEMSVTKFIDKERKTNDTKFSVKKLERQIPNEVTIS